MNVAWTERGRQLPSMTTLRFYYESQRADNHPCEISQAAWSRVGTGYSSGSPSTDPARRR